jgi:hypothetical protein
VTVAACACCACAGVIVNAIAATPAIIPNALPMSAMTDRISMRPPQDVRHYRAIEARQMFEIVSSVHPQVRSAAGLYSPVAFTIELTI